MNIRGKVDDPHKHVVKTCPFCNSTKPRPDRSRVSGLRAEEFGDLIFLDHGSTKIGNKTFGFLIVSDGATSHLTEYPCKSTSPSEVISKLHEWKETVHLNRKAICADVAFHHPHDMQAFHRIHNIKRLPRGPFSPWPNRAEMGVQEVSLSALVNTASKKSGPDHSGTDHSCPIDAQSTKGEKHTGNSEWQNAYRISHEKRTTYLMNPSFMNAEQLTSTSTKQDLLSEEIQKLTTQTHLEVQQREDIRRSC